MSDNIDYAKQQAATLLSSYGGGMDTAINKLAGAVLLAAAIVAEAIRQRSGDEERQ